MATTLSVPGEITVPTSQKQIRDPFARGRQAVLVAAVLALIAKLLIAWNTFGTNDVLTFYIFGKSLASQGLEWTYRNTILFNHPPLVAYYLRGIYSLHHLLLGAIGITFPFLLRLPGIIADFVVILILLQIKKNDSRLRLPTWALVIFALSPVSLMVSGYHGNTDSVMAMLLLVSVYFCTRGQPMLSGLFFALSAQVKVIPLLFFPILLIFWIQRGLLLRFVIPFAVASAVLWIEPLLEFPLVFARNVLSYGSYWGIWGLSYLLRLTGRPEFSRVSFFGLGPWQTFVVTGCKLFIIAAVLTLAWRRRKVDDRHIWDSIAYGWIVFFVFAPGVCTQYLVWLAPFILLLSPTFYTWLLGSSSIFAFVFYNTISNGLPWYKGASTNALNEIWTPWSVLPWLVLITGSIILWRNAKRADPSLRLFSLRAVNA
jgi:F0F1-type ATP synthase assembly protein I